MREREREGGLRKEESAVWAGEKGEREHRKHERKENCESKSSRRGKVRTWQEVRTSVKTEKLRKMKVGHVEETHL